MRIYFIVIALLIGQLIALADTINQSPNLINKNFDSTTVFYSDTLHPNPSVDSSKILLESYKKIIQDIRTQNSKIKPLNFINKANNYNVVIHKNTPDSVVDKSLNKDTVVKKQNVQKTKDTLQTVAQIDNNKTEKDKVKILDAERPELENVISVGKIFWALLFLLSAFITIRIVSKFLELLSEKSAKYRITIKGLIPIVRIIGWLIAIYVVIKGIINPPMSTIIAISASIGVAIGFASQDILKNIFGGIMLLLDRPFMVGDKIEIGNYYGEVVKIGLRSTRIVTPDDSLVSIPNGELMNSSVSNANAGEPNCQVVAEIYLPLKIDTEEVRKIALEVAQTSKYIYLNKPIVVLFFNVVKERRSYLKMRLKAYVLDIRYEFPFKSEMTEMVIKELIDRKILDYKELL